MKKPTEEKRRAYSVVEAAHICGISRAQIYRLLDDGKIGSVKIGARRLIRDEDIKALLQNGAP